MEWMKALISVCGYKRISTLRKCYKIPIEMNNFLKILFIKTYYTSLQKIASTLHMLQPITTAISLTPLSNQWRFDQVWKIIIGTGNSGILMWTGAAPEIAPAFQVFPPSMAIMDGFDHFVWNKVGRTQCARRVQDRDVLKQPHAVI